MALTAGDLCSKTEPVGIDLPIMDLHRAFLAAPDLNGIPVEAADGQVLGIISRDGLLHRMSNAHGHALLSRRTVATLLGLMPAPIVCTSETPITALAQIRDPLIAVTHQGRAIGVIDRERMLDGLVTLASHQAAALRTAYEEIQSANQAKDAFLAAMSHEIRTPLNAILGFAELLEAEECDPERSEMLSLINASGQALLRIINDILDLSRIAAGRFNLDIAPFAPWVVCDEVFRLLAENGRSKGLDMVFMIDGSVPKMLRGDAGRIRQISLNLLGNAIKFTARGAVGMTVSGEADGAGWLLRIVVTDTGPGISPEVIARLGQPFIQADQGPTRRHGGSGLGLAIAHRLAALMGGGLTARALPHGGSELTATIHCGLIHQPPLPRSDMPSEDRPSARLVRIIQTAAMPARTAQDA